MKIVTLCLGLAAGFLTALPAAADVDADSPLICAAVEIRECDPGDGCREVTPDQVGISRFFHIDLAGGRISRTRAGEETSSQIERSEVVDGRLVLQGAEDGLEQLRDGIGWSLSIDRESGNMVLTASGAGVAFVIFGDCTAN